MSKLCPHLLVLVLVSIGISRSLGLSNYYYTNCTRTFACGALTNIGYPFWGSNRGSFCGYPELELNCEDGVPALVLDSVKYRVLDFFPQTNVLRIARADYFDGICTTDYVNTKLDSQLFDLLPGYTNFTFLYGCPTQLPFTSALGQYSCSVNGVTNANVYIVPGLAGFSACFASVVIPVSFGLLSAWGNGTSALAELLRQGFEVKLNVDGSACSECSQSNGVCGYDLGLNRTTCYCPGQIFGSATCNSTTSGESPQSHIATQASSKTASSSLGKGLGIGGAGLAVALLGFCGFLMLRRKRRKVGSQTSNKDSSNAPTNKLLHISTSSFSRTTPSCPSSKSDLEKGSSYFGVQVFKYEELEAATRNFDPSRALGDGGFGTVYFGELRDGRAVAVKRLYERNLKRVEQFMNEIEILHRLHHPNLVKLYGCTSRRSQELVLVYEYIPNGTVADHICRSQKSPGWLPWSVRLNIAIETADALAYLHASDIIHRDVKTNNILLDNDFRVKVADFGLSRLFPTDVTHVSTAPQGTPGYVDPEYYQCYQLTNKSDVYSFGVVVCELISSKPAVDMNRHRHDINLASMSVNRIQNQLLHELVDPSLGFDKDYFVRRTVRSVAELAFRCLQEERDMRPTMDEIVDILRRIKSERVDEKKAEIMGDVLDSLKAGHHYENAGMKKAEVMDLRSEDVGLLKAMPPPLSPSPDSDVSLVWGSSPKAPNSI